MSNNAHNANNEEYDTLTNYSILKLQMKSKLAIYIGNLY